MAQAGSAQATGGPGQQLTQEQYDTLIKADQIAQFPFLDEKSKAEYTKALTVLQGHISSGNSPNYQHAVRKWAEITRDLRKRAAEYAHNVNSQQASQRPAQQPSAAQTAVATMQQTIQNRVDNMDLVAPYGVNSAEEREKYISEAKRRYTTTLFKKLLAQTNLTKTENQIKQIENQGQSVPQELVNNKQTYSDQLKEANEFISQLDAQQMKYKATLAASAAQPQKFPSEGVTQAQQLLPPLQTANIAQGGPGLQQATANRQVPNPSQQVHTAQNPTAQSATPVQPNTQGSPQPLDHRTAMQRASESYSKSTQPTISNIQPFVNGRTEAERGSKIPPMSKGYTPQPPQAVAMPPSRPTLAGTTNPSTGIMGQPALSKPPPYLLQGQGDRVLDRKKLDELVRQVMGSGGPEKVGLHPEVEESVLHLADEFIDNVIRSACKLAKVRGGTQLEIRDIQLVLERQYNIRIPGFATDEIRTVRKIQPTQGYLQKMNAVQASKVMGGSKTDS